MYLYGIGGQLSRISTRLRGVGIGVFLGILAPNGVRNFGFSE